MISKQNTMVPRRHTPIERETRMAVGGEDVIAVDMVHGLEERREDVQCARQRCLCDVIGQFVQGVVDAGAFEEPGVGAWGGGGGGGGGA